MSTESAFIDTLRALATDPAARDLIDDAAVLEMGEGALVLTHDMIVEGVHYLPTDPPEDVAWKLVAVNLSDLAAKGARPTGVLLGYALGDGDWDRAFAKGLGTALGTFGLPLLGGDTVAMHLGRLYVNGTAQPEPYVQRIDSLPDATSPDFAWQRDFLADRSSEARRRYRASRDEWGPLVVPSGKFFTLGDNRDNSHDSRYWGFVDMTAVKGRPLLVYFSYERGTQDPLPWLTDIRWSRLGSFIH